MIDSPSRSSRPLRLAFLALLLLAGTAGGQPGGDRPALVLTDRVARAEMAASILVPGTVVSRDDARIAAEVAGRLVALADVGSEHAAGETLARIEDTPLVLRRRELEAEVTRAEARRRFLAREEERLRSLADRDVAARNALDEVRSERDVAASELAVAQARLAQVADQLARTRVSAPFDGVVVEQLRRPGERLAVGDELVRMVAPDRLEVVARAPLQYLDYVAPGDPVTLTAGGRGLTGRVRTVVAVGDENTHLFEVRIDLEGAAAPVGQPARVRLPASERRTVVAVPRDALVLRPEGSSVFLVDEDGRARRVPVETGLAQGMAIEVRGALSVGDRVVVRGNERLRDGQAVRVQRGGEGTVGAGP